jgi:hypothetical protein
LDFLPPCKDGDSFVFFPEMPHFFTLSKLETTILVIRLVSKPDILLTMLNKEGFVFEAIWKSDFTMIPSGTSRGRSFHKEVTSHEKFLYILELRGMFK